MQDNVRYIRNADFIFRKIVEEMVLVPLHPDLDDVNYIFTLNNVGAFIWEQLTEPTTSKELHDLLMEQYSAAPETVGADLERYLDELISIGAIGAA